MDISQIDPNVLAVGGFALAGQVIACVALSRIVRSGPGAAKVSPPAGPAEPGRVVGKPVRWFPPVVAGVFATISMAMQWNHAYHDRPHVVPLDYSVPAFCSLLVGTIGLAVKEIVELNKVVCEDAWNKGR